MFTAHLFNSLVAERWENEESWASNRNIADTFCGNTESVVRRWRDGEKLVPLAVLRVLPAAFAEQLARRMVVDRGVGVRRPMAMLRESVERLAAPVAAEDRDEALRGLIDARDRLIKRIDRLAGEGK